MIEIVGLDHIVLRTSHMEEMLHFYGTVLGCPVERELSPEFGLLQLRAGTALIDLVAVDSELGRTGGGPPTEGDNNMDHFCLQVNSLPEEEICQHLASHGIEAGPFERRYGAQGYGNSVYLRDPDENIVELRNRM
jgi:glyoxylase I family protein